MYKLFYYYSLLVFIFIEDDLEARTRRTEALCWLAQGKKKKPGRLFLFLLILEINYIYFDKQKTDWIIYSTIKVTQNHI